MSEYKVLKRSFYIAYSVGALNIFLLTVYMVHVPLLLDILKITKVEFSFGLTLFGLCSIISNQATTLFLTPKIGTKNCIVISRTIISFLPLIVFFSESYFVFLIVSSIWGLAMGIQVPNVLLQVSIIEKETSEILNPIFKSAFSIGVICGSITASIALGYNINPINIFIFFGFIFILSAITIYFFGLPRKYDIVNKGSKFTLPSKGVFIFGLINMLIFASMGIIAQWSSLWLLNDLNAAIFMAGSIVLFFNIGGIISNFLASNLINLFNEKIVGPYFSIVGSIILIISITTMNLYIILLAMIIFGFFTSNLLPIVIRLAVKISKEPMPKTISHITSIGQAGALFGPAIVGFSASIFGLTFNMYALGFIFLGISFLLLTAIKNNTVVGVEGIEPTPPK